jgi:predicted MPP superfamily phosphohydrolase
MASLGRVTEPPAPAPRRGLHRWRPVGRWALRVVVAVAGAVLGILLLGHVTAPIGPFDAQLSFRPSLTGGAQVGIPPLGALAVDAYDGPLELDIQLRRIDQVRAQSLAAHPAWVDRIVDEVSTDLQSAVVRLVWVTAGSAVLGAAVTSLLLLRRWREPLIAVGTTLVLLAGTGGLGALTWRPEALSAPTYTGLLVNANSLIGSATDIVARFDAYRASLEDIVGNVSSLYATISTLPQPVATDPDVVTLLHVSDIHLNPAGFDLVRQVAQQFDVDGVLDTGDITDWGSRPETALITSVGDLGVPYAFIRGNHDSAVTAAVIASRANTTVLDYTATTIDGVTVVGAPDPRFTPDKSTGDDDFPVEQLAATGEQLADVVAGLDPAPAIAMVHDPEQAPALDGVVPVVLAGHTHDREVTELDGGTLLMVEGSTGGAGLRGLQGDYPEPLTCTVLYVDRSEGSLRAYDEITLGGLGLTEATIQRTVVDRPDDEQVPAGTPEDGAAEPDGDDEGAPASPAPATGATASPAG